jgi:DNA-binding MarR family transcriptional regulator/GNAT superfamily N-acetyltransferase
LTEATYCLIIARVPADLVPRIREFNRFYTRVIGVLQPDLAGSSFGLTQARVLYEIAHGDGPTAAELSGRLALDAGHLSRILAGFVDAGLIERAPSEQDRRRRVLRMTDDGLAAFAELDARQTDAITAMTSGLDPRSGESMVRAMGTIQSVLGERRSPATVVLRAPAPGDLGWVIERHGALYADEYGWDATFEGLVARIVADFTDARSSGARVAAWIAESDGRRLGCVFCTETPDGDAALRLLLVEPSARGTGVGAALIDECLRFARHSGFTRITLWTNDVLTAARRLYQRAGFQLDKTEPHQSFGADLVGEYWSRGL